MVLAGLAVIWLVVMVLAACDDLVRVERMFTPVEHDDELSR